MTTGKPPQPEAPGPIAGEPGHFAHHDWLTASVGMLDERLVKGWRADVVAPNITTATWGIAAKYDKIVLDTGLDIDLDTQGGGVVLGPGAPEGLYRVDIGVAFGGNATGYRHTRLTINGVEFPEFRVVAQNAGAATAAHVVLTTSGIAWLPALSVVKVECYQNSGATIPLKAVGFTRLWLEYLGVVPDPETGPPPTSTMEDE